MRLMRTRARLRKQASRGSPASAVYRTSGMAGANARLHQLGDGQFAYIAFTRPFNITGQSAISLPLSWNSAGLPIGVQLVAAYGREDQLINIAAQAEGQRMDGPVSHRCSSRADDGNYCRHGHS
jgi:hypothetical protein